MRLSISAFIFVVGSLLTAHAEAHAKLVQTMPAAQAEVVSPPKVELRFSERLVGAFSGADLYMVDMPGMKMSKPARESASAAVGADGITLTITPAKPLPAGTYRVDYHVVSVDTHKVTGTFSFRVK